MPVVSDVLVSPSYAVVVMSEASLSDSDWEIVEPQSSFSPESGRVVWVENQGNMSYEGTPVKAPPASRRKIMPPTQQSSQSSIEATQWQTEVEDHENGSCLKEFEEVNVGGLLVIERLLREWSST